MDIRRNPRFQKYGATEDGRVFRIAPVLNHRRVPYELKGCVQDDGYVKLTLQNDEGREVQTYAHVVVAETFLGLRPAGMEAAHGNGIRSDNRLANLRWDTPKGNSDDRWLHGTMNEGEKHVAAKLSEQDVIAIRSSNASPSALGNQFDVSATHIRRVRQKESWRHV